MDLSLLDRLRKENPVVLTVANLVTPMDVATGANLIGASPIMSAAKEEASDMVKLANAVTINLGTVSPSQFAEMRAVMDAANASQTPAVFDPIACNASSYRMDCAQELLGAYDWTVIRGNAGEIAALAGADWESRGIDAGQGDGDIVEITKKCAKKYHVIAVATGEIDVISDGENVAQIPFGSPLFTVHVGTGDMLSTIIAAFTGITNDFFTAAKTACLTFALAGQKAASHNASPRQWDQRFFDNLYIANAQTVNAWLKTVDA